MIKEELKLVQEWDKTFAKSDKVDAVHTDLYDGGGKDAIPFDKLTEFYMEYLK